MAEFPDLGRMMMAYLSQNAAEQSGLGGGGRRGAGANKGRTADHIPASYRFVGELSNVDKCDILRACDGQRFTSLSMRLMRPEVSYNIASLLFLLY